MYYGGRSVGAAPDRRVSCITWRSMRAPRACQRRQDDQPWALTRPRCLLALSIVLLSPRGAGGSWFSSRSTEPPSAEGSPPTGCDGGVAVENTDDLFPGQMEAMKILSTQDAYGEECAEWLSVELVGVQCSGLVAQHIWDGATACRSNCCELGKDACATWLYHGHHGCWMTSGACVLLPPPAGEGWVGASHTAAVDAATEADAKARPVPTTADEAVNQLWDDFRDAITDANKSRNWSIVLSLAEKMNGRLYRRAGDDGPGHDEGGGGGTGGVLSGDGADHVPDGPLSEHLQASLLSALHDVALPILLRQFAVNGNEVSGESQLLYASSIRNQRRQQKPVSLTPTRVLHCSHSTRAGEGQGRWL